MLETENDLVARTGAAPLKIGIDSTVISEALKIVATLAPPMTGNVIIDASGKDVFLVSIGLSSRCQLRLPCQKSGEGIFAIPLATITAAVRGRLTLTLSFHNDILNITSGSYRTTTATVDVIQEPQSSVEELGGKLITKHQAEWLQQALSDVYLKPDTLLNQTTHHVALQMTPEGAFLCCYDGERLAYAVTSEVTGDMDMVLPYNTISAVASTFGQSSFKVATTEGVMYVWNKVGIATLSMVAPKFTVPIPMLLGRIEDSRTDPDARWRLNIDEAKSFLLNAKAIANIETKNTIQVRIDRKASYLKVATSSGSSQVGIEAKATEETDFCIDYDYFGEFLNKGLSEVLVHKSYISGHDENFGMIVALNQPVTV